MTLSIIIVNYDTSALLKDCLDSIARFPPDCDYEIVIINNGSKRDKAEDLATLSGPLRVYDLAVNSGFGQANNLGMQRARGDYFLLLNSDTYFVDNSLQTCLDYAREHSEIDIFTCRIERSDGSVDQSTRSIPRSPGWGVFHEALKENALIEKFCAGFWDRHSPVSSGREWLSGCFLFLKREVFEVTKGFDPDFFLYYEETDWFSNRIYEAGFQSGVCSEATVIHLGGGAQTPNAIREQLLYSSFLYSHKLGRSAFWSLCSAFVLNFGTRLACMPFVPYRWKFNLNLQRRNLKFLWAAICDVPRYSREYGSRPAPLMTPEYGRHYSWSRLTEAALDGRVAKDEPGEGATR